MPTGASQDCHQHRLIVLTHARVTLADAQTSKAIKSLGASFADVGAGFGGHFR